MYFVWANFDEQNIDVALTGFVQRSFNRWKINTVSKHCFDIILISKNSMSFWFTFSGKILMDKKADIFSMYFLMSFWGKTYTNSSCWFWFIFEREKIVVALLSIFKLYFRIWFCFYALFQRNFFLPWIVIDDYTVFKNIYTSRYLIWFYLLAFTRILSKYFLKSCWKVRRSVHFQ